MEIEIRPLGTECRHFLLYQSKYIYFGLCFYFCKDNLVARKKAILGSNEQILVTVCLNERFFGEF